MGDRFAFGEHTTATFIFCLLLCREYTRSLLSVCLPLRAHRILSQIESARVSQAAHRVLPASSHYLGAAGNSQHHPRLPSPVVCRTSSTVLPHLPASCVDALTSTLPTASDSPDQQLRQQHHHHQIYFAVYLFFSCF